MMDPSITVKKRREELDRLKQKQQMRSSTDESTMLPGASRAPLPRGGPPRGPPPLPKGGGQSTPSVARKLDPSFESSPVPSASRAKSAPPTRPKPPPGPPPSTARPPTMTSGGTPASEMRGFSARPPPMTPGNRPPSPLIPTNLDQREIPPASDLSNMAPKQPGTQPLQPRRNMIQTLALGADTPASVKSSTSTSESSLLRLEKEVREHEKAKSEALRKVVILEEQVQKLKEKGDASDQLGKLVEISEKNGTSVALQWARDCVAGGTPKAFASTPSFFSPLSVTTPRTPRANTSKRAATPYPKPKQGSEKTGIMSAQEEKEEMDLIIESVRCTPYEFTTELATFIVRRPHGHATEKELWFSAGEMHAKQYGKTADEKDPKTLEIVALISADNSMLTLYDGNAVKHIGADSETNEFGIVDQMEKPLGTITYIDGDASEKDYSLDDVYEGAVSARETYCTSVVAMALGLKARRAAEGSQKPFRMPQPGGQPDVAKEPAQKVDVGVATDDLPAMAVPPGQANSASEGMEGKGENMQQKGGPPVPDDFDENSDTMPLVLGALVSGLLWILKTALLTIPGMVFQTVVSLIIFFALVAFVSLQIEDGDQHYMTSLFFNSRVM